MLRLEVKPSTQDLNQRVFAHKVNVFKKKLGHQENAESLPDGEHFPGALVFSVEGGVGSSSGSNDALS